ncbi:MAG: response regulator transcription factor [Myxococcales bacterium]|nr:response regulator transcription factor [Myxococcales bacterium]
MIRVYLADDHAILRQGLRKLLREAPDIEVVGECADGRQALQAMEQTACDVLILDLSLPRVSGIEVLRRLRASRPALRILVLSMYAEEQYALRMLREGASGYVSKDRPSDELLLAIRHVAAGRTYRSPELAERVRLGEADPQRPVHESLSAREYQVFDLLAQGRGVSDIAAELNLSKSTVSTYVQHIKGKLNVNTIGEIVRYAHQAGIVR